MSGNVYPEFGANGDGGAENLVVDSSNSTVQQIGSSTYDAGTRTITIDLQSTGGADGGATSIEVTSTSTDTVRQVGVSSYDSGLKKLTVELASKVPGAEGNVVEIGAAPNSVPTDSGLSIMNIIGNRPSLLVEMVYPSVGQDNVELLPDIIIQYSKIVGGVSAYTLVEDATGIPAPIFLKTALSNNRQVWTPTAPLKSNTRYRFNVDGGSDANGNTIASSNFYFTTGQNNIARLQYQYEQPGGVFFNNIRVPDDDYIYMVGSFQSATAYGRTRVGVVDGLFVKYDKDLNVIWSWSDGQASTNTVLYNLTVVGGYVYVVGGTGGSLHGYTNPGGYQYAVWKLDASDGSLVAYHQSASVGQTFADTAVIQMSENDFVISGFTFAPNLDGVPNPDTVGNQGFFIVKFDLALTREWTVMLGAPGWYGYGATDIAIDSVGNIAVSGSTQVGLFGNTQTGVFDVYWARLDPSGAVIASTQYGVADKIIYAYELAAKDNYLVLCGTTDTAFNGAVLNGQAGYFVQKVDLDFNNIWTTISQYDYNQADYIEPRTVVIDNNDYIYFVGNTNFSSIDGIATNPNYGGYYIKFDGDGNRLFTRGLGVGTTAQSMGITVTLDAKTNEVYICGFIGSGSLFPPVDSPDGSGIIMSFVVGEPTEALTYARSVMNYINDQNQDQYTRIDGSNILALPTDSPNYDTVNNIINQIDAVNWFNLSATFFPLMPTDRHIAVTVDATIQLPDVTTCTHAVVICAANDPITVTINAFETDTITGESTYILNTPWSSITLLPNTPFGSTTNNWSIA